MGFGAWYVIVFFLLFAVRYPLLLVAAAVVWLLRNRIPDPVILWRTSGRIHHLKIDIRANPSNQTARRDLALIYLQRRRPRAALRLLDEARARDPENPELQFLTGLCRLRMGDAKNAVEPLVSAANLDPRMRLGEPFLMAGCALAKLDRLEDADDAFSHYVQINSSSVEGHARLSDARRRRGDRAGADAALAEALSTYAQLPSFRRRKDFGWWLRAQWMRI